MKEKVVVRQRPGAGQGVGEGQKGESEVRGGDGGRLSKKNV